MAVFIVSPALLVVVEYIPVLTFYQGALAHESEHTCP